MILEILLWRNPTELDLVEIRLDGRPHTIRMSAISHCNEDVN